MGLALRDSRSELTRLRQLVKPRRRSSHCRDASWIGSEAEGKFSGVLGQKDGRELEVGVDRGARVSGVDLLKLPLG